MSEENAETVNPHNDWVVTVLTSNQLWTPQEKIDIAAGLKSALGARTDHPYVVIVNGEHMTAEIEKIIHHPFTLTVVRREGVHTLPFIPEFI